MLTRQKAFWMIGVFAVAGLMAAFGLRVAEALPFAASSPLPPPILRRVTTSLYLPTVTRYYDPTYVSPFGIVMYENVDDASGLAAMQAVGSQWVTTVFFWAATEPTPPVGGVHTYNWTNWDTRVNNARAAGMETYVLFTGNPAWAAYLTGGPVTDTQSLIDVAAAMAERYDGDGLADALGNPVVNYWSFYPEPDNGGFGAEGYWGFRGPDYAAMLAQVSSAIHAANPRAKVLIGGVAYDWFNTDQPNPGPFVSTFLTDTLSVLVGMPGGAPSVIDAMAFHFYPINALRWPTIKEKALEVRTIMNNHGVGHLPLLVPETGYWSDPVPLYPPFDSDPDQQARRLVQIFVQGLAVEIDLLSWFAVFDHGTATDAHGLFYNNDLYQPKPAYTAYQTLTRELDGMYYSAPVAAGGTEGYLFVRPDGQSRVVVWGTTNPTTTIAFSRTCLRVVDKYGIVTEIVDGGVGDQDFAINGQVAVLVYQDQPLYISVCA